MEECVLAARSLASRGREGKGGIDSVCHHSLGRKAERGSRKHNARSSLLYPVFKSLPFLSSSKFMSGHTHFLKRSYYLLPHSKEHTPGPVSRRGQLGHLFLVLQTASNLAPPSLLLCGFQMQILIQIHVVTLCRACPCPWVPEGLSLLLPACPPRSVYV